MNTPTIATAARRGEPIAAPGTHPRYLCLEGVQWDRVQSGQCGLGPTPTSWASNGLTDLLESALIPLRGH